MGEITFFLAIRIHRYAIILSILCKKVLQPFLSKSSKVSLGFIRDLYLVCFHVLVNFLQQQPKYVL